MRTKLLSLLVLALFCSTYAAVASAQQTGSVPYAAIVFGERSYASKDQDLTIACIASLKSAIERCKNAGGKPVGLTSLLPDITKTSITSTDGSISSVMFGCIWNIGCDFPSREAVPYLFEGQF